MTRTTTTAVAAAAAVAMAGLVNQAGGHMIQTYPYSRQYAHSSATDELPDGKDKPFFEGCAACYNSGGEGGVENVMKRGQRLTDSDVLDAHGGGEVYPLPWGKYADNGNYLESDEIAKRHGICGDPSSGHEDDFNRYGVASSNFDVYHEYKAGESFHIDILMWAWHSGHMEFFICNTDELPQGADSVPTQECFNKIPLDRDPNYGNFSPIDPSYYGRYHLDPECTADETNIEVMNDWRGWIARMHYLIPDDLECEHCVLQAVYRTGHQCRHPGYDEFNPPEPFSSSKCAPDKDAWVRSPTSGVCGDPGTRYAEEFWACTDIRVVGSGDGPTPTVPDEIPAPVPETPSPTPEETPEPEPETPSPTPEETPEPEPETPSPTPEETPEPESGTASPTYLEETPGSVTRQHLGCFADKKKDRVLEHHLDSGAMTTDVCCDFCAERGDAFCATQYSEECWCSDEVDLVHDRHGDAECDYPCTGDETEMCGGYDAFDVYLLTYPTTEEEEKLAPEAPEPTTPDEDECLVVKIEAETLDLHGSWKKVSADDASGGAYITWEGLEPEKNNRDAEDGDIITTMIQIPAAGTYSFKWLMRQSPGVESDRANDSWLYFPNAARFGPANTGDKYGGFIKVFGNSFGVFKYSGRADVDHKKSEVAVEFDSAGEYEMQISGRSHGHQIDQIMLYSDTMSLDDASEGC